MPTASDRQQQWPRYAGRARRRTEETAGDHAELLRHVLQALEQAQLSVFDNPKLVHEALILAQRDVALAVAAFADIQRWMVDAGRGRAGTEESNGA